MEQKRKKMIFIAIIIGIIILVICCLFCKFNKTSNYVITFDTNGGNKIVNQNVKEGELVKKPNAPTKDGYIFVGWSYEGKDFDFSTPISKDIVLKAIWKKEEDNKITYVVKFDTDGGNEISSQIVTKGEKIKEPPEPTKDGYEFIGWYNKNKKYNFENKVYKDLILIVKWKELENKSEEIKNNNSNNNSNNNVSNSNNYDNSTTIPKKEYIVTFDSNGGSNIESQKVIEGNKVLLPSIPTKYGYKFAGWMLNGSEYDFNMPVNSNITLIAKWEQKSYVVKINMVDDYSPARILTVFEDGTQIVVKSINYTDGTFICSGANANVNKNVLIGETKLQLELNDGTKVIATINE